MRIFLRRPSRSSGQMAAAMQKSGYGPVPKHAPLETEPQEVDSEVLDKLEQAVVCKGFLHMLEEAQRHPLDAQAQAPEESDGSVCSDSTWEHASLPSATTEGSTSTSPSGAGGEAAAAGLSEAAGWVGVDRQDAVEAMAFYIAQCIWRHPEAQGMTPKQLQDALAGVFKTLKQSKFKRLCSVGRSVYRWTTLGYSAVQMWQNPWIVRLVITAIWTFSRMSIRAFLP